MNPFQDKRFARSLLFLLWALVLLVVFLWMILTPRISEDFHPSTPRGKVFEPAPNGLVNLFDREFFNSFKTAYISNNPYYYPVPPPPAPAPTPAPPPPTTKAYKLQYKGFFTTTHGDEFAYLGVDDGLSLLRVGEVAVEDLHLQEITSDKLVLKTGANSLSEMVLELPFDVEQTPQVPLKK